MAGVGLPAGCYLQNAQGQFITCAGTVTSTKILRPTTPELAQEVGCPETVFAHDGAYFRDSVFRKFDALLTRPIDTINEDGEIFVSLGQDGKCAGDPKVKAAFDKFNASQAGAGTWETYSSTFLRLISLCSEKVSNRSICMEFYLYFNKRAFGMTKGSYWPE